MSKNFIRFAAFILTVMAISHSFLYFSFSHFLNITSSKAKIILIVCLFFLAISFVMASLLVRVYYNTITKFYYTIAGLWFGLAVYLIMAAIFVWLIKGILFIVPYPVSEKIPYLITITLVVLAVIYTGFSFYKTFNIKLERIVVPIKNLPSQWRGKTIAHLSDLHIGTFREKPFLNKIVKIVNELKPDIIAITGDLFDGASGDHQCYVPELSSLKAKDAVFFVTGNHEVYAGPDSPIKAIKDSGIGIIDNDIVEVNGLLFVGIGYPLLESEESHSFDIRSHPNYQFEKAKVLLFHTPTDIGKDSVNSNLHSEAYLAPKTAFDNAINSGISLQLSGHTHAGQYIPFTWLTKRIYQNYHYGLHKIEDFHIYISSGTGTWGPPIRSGCASEIAIITLD